METRFSRRTFVAWVGGASAGFYLFGRLPGTSAPEALAQIPGGTLDPADGAEVPDAAADPAGDAAGGDDHDARRQAGRLLRDLDAAVLAADPARGPAATTVWGYGAVKSAQSNRGLLIHNAPSLTIEAQWNRPVRVKWINELEDANGNYLPHLLPVDPTLHWANPPGGTAGRDMRPTFTTTPGPYTGPVPIVTHVHGAVGVGDESDGYAEAWYLPAATTSRPATRPRAPGTTSSPARPPSTLGVAWGPGSRPSSTRTTTGRRRSGTTTTRSA